MKKHGEITVFLSLSLLCVFALLCVMVEGARTAGSRYYFQVAVNGSLDTLFSQYHTELWKRYRILGLPYQSESDVAGRLETYVEKYLSVENWYPMRFKTMDIEECVNLTDQGGDFLVQEVLDYMNYGIWNQLLLVPESGEQFWSDMKEASAAGTATDIYDGQEKEVQKLEDCVEQILSCVQKQETYRENIRKALEDDNAGRFYREADKFKKEGGKMEKLLEKYEKRAKQLREALSESKIHMSDLKDEFQDGRNQMFEEQMNPYTAYIEQDGKRYQEFLQQKDISIRNLEILEETRELVEQLEEEAEENQDDESDDELSLEPAARHWETACAAKLKLEIGKGDKEKQGFLEQVRRMTEGGLLQAVLPEGMEVSGKTIGTAGLPSHLFVGGKKINRSLPEQVLINEYCGEYFRHALSKNDKGAWYEIEYLLHGRGTDRANLEETIAQIFLVRQGLNMIHLLSDSAKREEARALAALITGIVGAAPLLEIMAGFILVVWSMGESVMDIRCLLSGGSVPLWKGKDDWSLSLEGLLAMGKENRCPDSQQKDQGGRGFDYETYLKLLLLVEDAGQKQLRMLDMIQLNIQSEEKGFLLEHCAYKVDIHVSSCGKHVFFMLPVVENFIHGESGYPVEAKGEKIY